MNIVVFIKPVPDLTKIKISKGQGQIFETGKQIMNSYDRVGLQVAIELKHQHSGSVIGISLCDMSRTDILREAYAVGCDRCICVWDEKFETNDASVNAHIFGETVRKIGDVDLIICGAKSDMGFSGQTGPRLAEYLNIPHVSQITSVDSDDNKISVEYLNNFKRTVNLPALITVDSNAAEPKLPNALNIMKAFKKEVTNWSLPDLNMDESFAGEAAGKVTIRSQFLSEQ